MLQKQSIPINFQNGMDTKTDEKQLDLGTMYSIVNGIYTTPRKIEKRAGYGALSNYETNGDQLQDLQSLAVFNNELVAFSDTNLFSYSDNINKWVDRGDMSNLNITSNSVLRNSYNATKITSAVINNVALFAWKDSSGGCHYSIIDLDTNTFFQSDVRFTTSGDNPKIVVNQNQFYIFYSETTNLKYRKINYATPTEIGSEITTKTDLDSSNPRFDVKNVNDRIYVAYNSSDVNNLLKIYFLTSNDSPSSTTGFGASINADDAIAVNYDSNDRIWLAYHNGTSLYSICLTYGLGNILIPQTLIETIANVRNISIHQSASSVMAILYTIANATTSKTKIRLNTITTGAVVGTAQDFLLSVGQASKMFSYNDVVYTLVVHDSPLQQTYFLVNLSGVVQARYSAGVGGTVIAQNNINEVHQISTGKFLAATQIKSLLSIGSTGSTVVSNFGVSRQVINFEPTLNYQDTTLGQNLYVSGGILKNYDGSTITEDGFFLYPEGLTAGTNSASGGSMENGTYQYIAIYSWFDNRGQLHRSATSIPLTVTTSAGGNNQTQQIIIPTLRLTQKTNVFIELYRTENAGTIFYAVTSLTSPNFNTTTADTITITDTLRDTSIISRERLYTTGGVLDNDPAPNASIITNWKNRLVLAGLEDPQQIAYSKEYATGSPAQFSDFFRISISNQGGDITALGVLDDKLIIFKDSYIFALSGNGPNSLGEQNDYGTPDQISSDAGCSDPSSIVVTPYGIMFKSRKGIYLLDRGLTPQYIGAPVEAYNQYTITAATLVPNSNQVRFLTSNNYALVYDTYFQKWSVFDNHGGKDAEIFNNKYTYLRNDGLIFKEDESYLDNGEPISLQIDTGWLSFAGIQGFQRTYKMLGLGDYFSPHTLKIQAAYNYNDIFTTEKSISSSQFINESTYGDSTDYGSDAYYGGDANLNAYQFRLDMKIQKAQSIRVRIQELQNDTYGRGLSLSNLNFEIGVKSGTGKINQAQTFGMSR